MKIFNQRKMTSYVSGAANEANASNVPPLQDFFGSLSPDRSRMLAEDQFARETYNLPKAYEGRNLFLENVLDYLITNESDWYTAYALPWVKTDQLSVQWEIFRFNKTLFDLEPEQGPPRYVSAEREARSDRLVRRGLGFIIEHGFYETEEGKSHYLMNLRQISDSVHETAYFGVMSALLSSKDYYKAYRAEHGPIRRNFMDLTRQERNRWSLIQKDEHGLHMLDAEVKHEMRRHGREHNMIVLPDTTSMYVTMVPDYQKEYSRHGPGVSENLSKGEDNMLTFRGSRVVESKPFDIDFIGEGIDLLLRERQIGEYFVMNYEDPSIKIYSADTDKFEEVKRDDIKWYINASGEIVDVEGTGNNKTNLGKAFVIARPFQRYLMGSALFLNGGLQLGATYHGHHNFMLSDDIVRKVHVGHYTFYHKSIIKDDKNLTIAEDIICRDYLGGEGHTFLSKEDLNSAQFGNWDLVEGSLMAIEIGTDLVDGDTNINSYSELFSKLPNPLSLNGSYDGEPYAARYENTNNKKEGPNITDDKILSLYPRNGNNNSERFLSDIRINNSLCYQGLQKQGDEVINLNSGHWGRNGSGEGCAAVRRGENAFLKEKDYQTKQAKPADPRQLEEKGGDEKEETEDNEEEKKKKVIVSGDGSNNNGLALPTRAGSFGTTAARRRAKSKKESGVIGPNI